MRPGPGEQLRRCHRRARSLSGQVTDRLFGPPLSPPRGLSDLPDQVLASRPLLVRLLTDNLLPFWYPSVLDPAGGYRFDLDPGGRFVRAARVHRTISTARAVWFFAAVSATPWGEPAHLDAARHGFTTLRTCLWDERDGGFFYECAPDGSPTRSFKDVYAHAFALMALAELARVGGDPEARRLADRCAELLDRYAHDDVHGAYGEVFSREWQPLAEPPAGGHQRHPTLRTLNCHVHLLEALVSYTTLRPSAASLARVAEVARVLAERSVDPDAGVGIDVHDPDWTPRPELSAPGQAVSYGHEAERVSGLARAADLLGLDRASVDARLEGLVAGQLRWGFDRWRGGVFHGGPIAGPADDRSKLWWVQAESMLAFLVVHTRTGDARAGEAYLRTLGWIDRHQVDWAGGEWYPRVGAFGRPSGDKASLWKTPFHVGRALLRSLALLDDLRADRAG